MDSIDCRFLNGWLCTHSDFRGYICCENYCIVEMTPEEKDKRRIDGFYKQCRDGLSYSEGSYRRFKDKWASTPPTFEEEFVTEPRPAE